jgi:glycosyltransferase involved in cell wall biosynthesis
MTNESRIFKEARFISSLNKFDKIILFGVGDDNLKNNEQYNDNIFIKRIKLFNIKKRSIQYLYYYLYIFIYLITKRPKQVNIHTLEFLPLSIICKFFSLKVIYDTHELETEKNNLHGIRKSISKVIERIFIKFTDKVIVVGDAIAYDYKALYPFMEKPSVILNCPNYVNIEKKDLFREKFKISSSKIIFLYQGDFGIGRNIEKLINVFSKMDNDKALVFMGDGPLEYMVKESSERYDNIYFQQAVSPSVLLEYTSSADVGLSMIENTSKSYNYCMPNKMFEYMMAELPIIVTNLFEMSNFINNNNIGYILKNDSIEEIMEIINRIDKYKIKVFTENLKIAKNKYNWEEQIKILEKIYNDVYTIKEK